MIKADNLTKRFQGVTAVDHIHAEIQDGTVFGLIGTNGAGKSTFLRMAAGILKPDEGTITLDGESVFEDTRVKARCFYIPDEPYFLGNGTADDMKTFYQGIYPNFDTDRFGKLLKSFELDGRRKIQTFSKGMKKQLAVLLGICAGTDYLFCDETFDGLDPVMRQTVKSLFANDLEERHLTPVIASHNLRELEDICDHVGLLHRGGMLLSKDLDIMTAEQRGSLLTLTVRGQKEEIQARMQSYHPVFFEMIPLSLEEIFISETEVAGYDIKKLIF